MAKDTALRIRTAALELFSTRWFETVSIAEVCRAAGVSNSVFYRYYKKKYDLVQDLIQTFLQQFEDELSGIQGSSLRERLEDMYRIILKAGAEHYSEVAIFREGQYRFPVYESRLRDIYLSCCEQVFQRSISEAEYLYIISGLRFNSTRAMYDGLDRNISDITDFVLTGILPDDTFSSASLNLPRNFPIISEEAPQTGRDRLIHSGIELLGQSGYHSIGVGDIAHKSGLAVGTFYTHFESKEAFFSEIIKLIGSQTRKYLRENTDPGLSRLEQEAFGIWHFLSYFNKHPQYYAIVREAEFVAKPWVRQYYDAFESGYIKNLPMSDLHRRRIAGNFLMGLSHYIGIEALLNHRIEDIPDFIHQTAKLMNMGVRQ